MPKSSRHQYPFGTSPDRGGIVHGIATCYECGWEVEGRNVMGLAAQHAGKTGHHVNCEIGHSYSWNTPSK